MTAILTKQNAADKALVGGGSGGGEITNGGSALLNNLHVYNKATFDGETEFSNLDGSRVTFNSTPVFENDITVNIKRDEDNESIPYSMKNIVEGIEYNGDRIDILKRNDDVIDSTLDACLDEWSNLSNTINNHLATNPCIDKNETTTQSDNNTVAGHEMHITLNSTPQLLANDRIAPSNNVVEGDVIENPDETDNTPINITITPEDITQTMNELNTAINDSLTHFETNDRTLNEKTIENKAAIDLINKSITNINFDLGEKNKDIVEIYDTLQQHKKDIDDADETISILSNTVAFPADIDKAKDEINGTITSLTNQLNDFKATTETSLSNKYNKTDVDSLLSPINENISLAASNISLLTDRMNKLPTTETLDNYATNEQLTAVDNKFTNYTLKTDLTTEINTINSKIETKADKTSLNTLVTNDELTTVDNKVDKLESSFKALIDQIHSLDKSQENHLDANVMQSNEIQSYSMKRTRAAFQNVEDEINDVKVNDVMVDWITTMNDSFNHFEDNDKTLMTKFDDYYSKTESDNKFALKGDNSNNSLSSLTTKRYSENELEKIGWFLVLCETDEMDENNGLYLSYTTGKVQLNCINYWTVNHNHLLLYLDSSSGKEIATIEINVIERLVIINGLKKLISSNKFLIYDGYDSIADAVDIPFSTGSSFKITIDDSVFIAESNIKFKLYSDGNQSNFWIFNILPRLNTISLLENTTITHYCPIEAGEEISDYKIGKPVFMSGHVYKYENERWVSSTTNDSTDCICSVINDGTWKEFVGIIVNIDEKNGCIKFASHGDFLFYVDDSNIYQIGDVILYDGKILDENYAMTLKIQQSIVGKVSGKINEHYIAIFKD